MTNQKQEKLVKVCITDNTGHTTLEQTLEAAVQTAVDAHFKQGKWIFDGARVFQFTAASSSDTVAIIQDTARLVEMLNESDEPIMTITGVAVGGVWVGLNGFVDPPTTPLGNTTNTFQPSEPKTCSATTGIEGYIEGIVKRVVAKYVEENNIKDNSYEEFPIDSNELDDASGIVKTVQLLKDTLDESSNGRVLVTLE